MSDLQISHPNSSDEWDNIRIIGIVGSRRRNSPHDYKEVEHAFFKIYKEGDWIISGGCPEGGDNFAELIAKKEGIPIIIFPANWGKYGISARLKRNTDIAWHSDILLACPSKTRRGGTEDTIRKFKRLHPNSKLILVV